MRSFFFNVGFWWISILYVLLAAVLALTPGHGGVRWAVRRYSKRMVQLMKLIGIKPEARGRERLPPPPFIVAPKHSSYGDGFMMYVQFDDVAFVTGDHLERFPLVPKVLEKLGAIVIDNCGGSEARKDLEANFAKAAEDKRIVLIYPEGHLTKVGEHLRFRAGVWHMQDASGWPVVPVATNLGLRWQQEDFQKFPGPAVIEFLDPIMPGLGKDEFLKQLGDAIRTNTDRLIEEGRVWDAKNGVVRQAPIQTSATFREAQFPSNPSLQDSIRKILFGEWDPIDVNSNRNLSDEYDDVILQVESLMKSGAGIEALTGFLERYEKSISCVTSEDKRRLVADLLLELKP